MKEKIQEVFCMKKSKLLLVSLFMMIAVALSACTSGSEESKQSDADTAEKTTGEDTEQSDEQTNQDDGQMTEETGAGMQLLAHDEVGNYLADSEGMTLYYFKKDEEGVSNCKGECLQKWPAFYTEDLTIPDGFDKSDFGTITREDTSEKQVTYKGYSLYYFFKDKAKGDVKGQGAKDVWYIVNSETTFKE
jgi:predicted lipoprotein with Yx(FWY)xxD motif